MHKLVHLVCRDITKRQYLQGWIRDQDPRGWFQCKLFFVFHSVDTVVYQDCCKIEYLSISFQGIAALH